MRFFCSAVILFITQTVACHDKLKIKTPMGEILGTTLKSRLGKTIYGFKAIRYAEPPINDLRFKPPVPIEKWDGVYDATSNGTLCPQPTSGSLPVSEDCLFLNVYTTKLPKNGVNPKRPVIIHLHPGAFYSSTGYSGLAGPQYFMDQDIVLVTLNYRLGSLGFLSLGTKDAPGNNGLRDQVLAMKWVQKNIESFGGDRDSVTLYGYSAGASSISLHMVSDMSRGLFHKAILGSGSALGEWPVPRSQLDVAKKQARIVGCPDTTPEEILKCLKTIPSEILGNSLFQFFEFGNNPILIWSPVVEQDFGQERFLKEDPVKAFDRGDFEKVPVVLGVTKDEFANLAFPLVNNETLLRQLDENFDVYAPLCFVFKRNATVSGTVRKFYLGEGPLTKKSSLEGLTKLEADSIVGFPVNRAAKLIAAKNTRPVYYYDFTYQGRYSNFYLPGTNNTIPYGVVHHDDLMYTFYISLQFPFFGPDFPERKMVDQLTKLYANFAKTGNPTPDSDILFDTKWEKYDLKRQRYLDIGERLVMKEKLHSERYGVWEKLYPISQ